VELKQNLSIKIVRGLYWVLDPDGNRAFPFEDEETAIIGLDRLATEYDLWTSTYISRPIDIIDPLAEETS
jgi:hypothetical protein